MHRNAKRHAPRLELLEERLCLAGSVGWDGPGQGSASLTYYIGGAPPSLTLATVQAALQTALGAWSAVADISFTQTSQPNRPRSIDFTFGTIDGPGGTLAEGYLPDDLNPSAIAGDVHFDVAEVWEVGNDLGYAAMDLVLTAAHEIGHALGLDHSDVADSLMAPTVTPDGRFTGLAPTDVASILALYAPAGLKTSTTSTPPTTTRTIPTTTPTTRSTPTTSSTPKTIPTPPTTTRTTPTPPMTPPTTTRTTPTPPMTPPTTTRTTPTPPTTTTPPTAPTTTTPPTAPTTAPTTTTPPTAPTTTTPPPPAATTTPTPPAPTSPTPPALTPPPPPPAPMTTPTPASTNETSTPTTPTNPDDNPVNRTVPKSPRFSRARWLARLRRQRRMGRPVA